MLVMSTYGRFHFSQAADALADGSGEVLLHVADPLARTRRARMVRHGLAQVVGNALLRKFRPPWMERALIDRFDAAVARWIPRRREGIEGFLGGALYCARSLEACRRHGVPAMVERSGAHVDAQREFMAVEHERLGVAPDRSGYGSTDDYRDRMLAEYEMADRIVVSSSFARDTFLARGVPGEKVSVVPLGANFTARPKRGGRDGRFVVLTVGNEFVRKGIADVVEAWKLADLPDAELRIRSTLPEAWVRRVRALSNVTLLPPMPHARMLRHFDEASVFCLLSIEDGFGMVVSEAMACGCPVVISENVGAKDIVEQGRNGFVVPVRDPGAAAERLVRLHRDRALLAHMGHAALATAGAYSWSRYASGLSAAWREIGRPTAPARAPAP